MLHFMTWNVRYFGHGTSGMRATAGTMRRAAEAIAGLPHPPEVLLLQEVEGERSLRGGLGEIGQADRFRGAVNLALHNAGYSWRYRAHYFPAHRYGGERLAVYTTGLAALIAEDIVVEAEGVAEITHVRLPALGRFKQKRLVCHLRLRPPGEGAEAVDVFNTHLSLPAFFEGSGGPATVPARMGAGSNQLAEIEAVLAEVAQRRAGEGAAVVLGGDLNSLPGSPVLERLREAGLVDISGVEAGAGTARFAHLRMHLDHLLGSAALAAEGGPFWAVDDPSGVFTGLSDHAPKLAAVRGVRRSAAGEE